MELWNFIRTSFLYGILKLLQLMEFEPKIGKNFKKNKSIN